MNLKTIFVIATVFACSLVFASYKDYDCQVGITPIGDLNLIMMSGQFMLTTPVSIDLSPTNAPESSAICSVRCRVVYKNNTVVRWSDDDHDTICLYNDVINLMLEDFFAAECNGREYADLLEHYCSGEFADDLDERFTLYVGNTISQKNKQEVLDVNIVTVEIEAEGSFKGDLQEFRQEHPIEGE